MSRRESRASMNAAKQNDVLFEFENYKKKFALQNKHITKLNSTLSVRIEELTAEVSTLRAENLILRASENALKAQLRQEHEKSRKILAQAEAAIAAQFQAVRAAMKIEPGSPPPPSPKLPRAQRPPPKQYPSSPTSSPLRVCRAPSVPEINEEDETGMSDSEAARRSPTLRKTKAKPRLSGSRLPMPQRTISPPLDATPGPSMRIDFTSLTPAPPKRISTARRQSGLLTIDTQVARETTRMERPGSPSPVRETIDIPDEDDDEEAPKPEKKKRTRVDKEQQVVEATETVRRKRKTAETDQAPTVLASVTRFKDVTNAVQGGLHGGFQPQRVPKAQPDEPSPPPEAAPSPRPFLVEPADPMRQRSSSPIPSDGEAGLGGRERRVRKSVNYAEPKLNTKMRKPDPPPGSAPTTTHAKKRASSSTSSAPRTSHPLTEPEDEEEDGDRRASHARKRTTTPRVSSNTEPEDDTEEPERRSSLERRKSLERHRAREAEAAPPEEDLQRAVRRKKSRPQVMPPDACDDSDGGDADGEWMPTTRNFVNVEGRRKSSAAGGSRRTSRVGDDALRRHSVAA
ncbi:hypothetical protein K523DRAFT_371443 [Schizophyllum commune Tattone D]|nr:hypothetical protein K523DRAFT_371443 [Schizophyllum commune Tattone D]